VLRQRRSVFIKTKSVCIKTERVGPHLDKGVKSALKQSRSVCIGTTMLCLH